MEQYNAFIIYVFIDKCVGMLKVIKIDVKYVNYIHFCVPFVPKTFHILRLLHQSRPATFGCDSAPH